MSADQAAVRAEIADVERRMAGLRHWKRKILGWNGGCLKGVT